MLVILNRQLKITISFLAHVHGGITMSQVLS